MRWKIRREARHVSSSGNGDRAESFEVLYAWRALVIKCHEIRKQPTSSNKVPGDSAWHLAAPSIVDSSNIADHRIAIGSEHTHTTPKYSIKSAPNYCVSIILSSRCDAAVSIDQWTRLRPCAGHCADQVLISGPNIRGRSLLRSPWPSVNFGAKHTWPQPASLTLTKC